MLAVGPGSFEGGGVHNTGSNHYSSHIHREIAAINKKNGGVMDDRVQRLEAEVAKLKRDNARIIQNF